jgi:hypothetical protein
MNREANDQNGLLGPETSIAGFGFATGVTIGAIGASVTPPFGGKVLGISFFGASFGAGIASAAGAAEAQSQHSLAPCLPRKREKSPARLQPVSQVLQVGAGAQVFTGAHVGAGAQQVVASQPQALLCELHLSRENRLGLAHESQVAPQLAPQLPLEQDGPETTAGAGVAGAASAPAIQAEVSMNNAAFTITNLR